MGQKPYPRWQPNERDARLAVLAKGNTASPDGNHGFLILKTRSF